MAPEPEGNDPPRGTQPDPSPSTFQYSVTYPASLYSPGPGQSTAPPEPDQPPAGTRGVGQGWRNPVVRLAALAVTGLLVGALVVLGVHGWPVRSSPDITIGPTRPAPAAQAPGVDPAAAQAVEAWLRGGGQLVIDNLASDYRKVAATMAANDVQGLVPACGALRTSAETAQAYPPIPDSEAQVHWAASLAQSARAGTDCLAGIAADHLELIAQAGHEAGASSRESALMNARITTVRGN